MSKSKFEQGDWIIHASKSDEADRGYGHHTIYVVEATEHHLTIYDPLFGNENILPLYTYPDFVSATGVQIDVTWSEAIRCRGEGDNRVTHAEMVKYCPALALSKVLMEEPKKPDSSLMPPANLLPNSTGMPGMGPKGGQTMKGGPWGSTH